MHKTQGTVVDQTPEDIRVRVIRRGRDDLRLAGELAAADLLETADVVELAIALRSLGRVS